MKKKELNLNEFRNYIKDRKCICFGTGIQGIRIINIFENWGKTDDILAFIDNDSNKHGKLMEYGDFCYPIMPINKAFEFLNQEIVLIITCADFLNIRVQLEQYSELKDVPCFSLIEIGKKELTVSDYKAIMHEYTDMVIPKKIHYCWFGDRMPELMKKNIQQWRDLCPDYEIIEWNENNYDVNKNQYTKQAYEMGKWGYVPDYIRLDLIYQYGGIYLDTDVEIVKTLDDLLYQDGFASFDSSLLVNLGAGFGAKAGGYIIKELRDYYNDKQFYYSDGKYNKISCMTHSYNVLKEYGIVINDQFQKVGDINIYPMIFQGTCAYTRQMRITDNTFFLHYGTTTWLDKKNNEIRCKLGEAFEEESDKGLVSYDLK